MLACCSTSELGAVQGGDRAPSFGTVLYGVAGMYEVWALRIGGRATERLGKVADLGLSRARWGIGAAGRKS